METSLKQIAILAVVAANPGISGPDLHAALGGLVPLIQFPQHISRLRNRGFITTERCETNRRMSLHLLTPEGEAELNSTLEVLRFVQKQAKRRPNVS